MSDVATIDAPPANPLPVAEQTEARSTVIDTDKAPPASGGGVVREQSAQEPTLRETIEAAMKAEDAEAEKPAQDKPEPEAKKDDPAKPEKAEIDKSEPKAARERGDDGKFKPVAKNDAPASEAELEDSGEAADESKLASHIAPPSRFLPDAKERWTNTPRAVQRDIDNLIREYDGEIERHREANQRYETLRPFDDLARSHGRDLPETLAKINQFENLMRANVPAAINAILQEIGPRKADGSAINLYELANAVLQQGPESYQHSIAQANQQQQIAQRDAETEALRRENEALRAQQQASAIEAQVIAPFRTTHPRYDDLQEDIAFFLNSGRISEGLSPADRLEAAYAMAERLNPSFSRSVSPASGPDHDARVEHDSSGSKSIKSAPGAVSDVEDVSAHGSIRDLLNRNMAKISRSG